MKRKPINNFADEIPMMIERACRLNGISREELADRMGYTPETISRYANGGYVGGMPLYKLTKLLDLSDCFYEWKRKV